jgi:hypothetical protein
LDPGPILTRAQIRGLLIVLVLIELAMVALYLSEALGFFQSDTVHVMFGLDRERNIPAWFSATQLAMIGAGWALLAARAPQAYRPRRLFFAVLALGFLFFSMDEAVSFHEWLGPILKRVNAPTVGGHGNWIPLYGALGVVGVLLFLRDARRLWRWSPADFRLAAFGALIFVTGAVGLEIVAYKFLRGKHHLPIYSVQVGAEEFLEMLGASVMLIAVLRFAAAGKPDEVASPQAETEAASAQVGRPGSV